jgi:hypothetical protein
MNLETVKQLLAAGFTHDEIMSFNNPQNPQVIPQDNTNNSQDDTHTQPAGDQPGPESDPVSDHQENNQEPQNDYNERFDALTSMIEDVKKSIQASNLQNNFVETVNHASLEKQVDDIMKTIIRPEKEENTHER